MNRKSLIRIIKDFIQKRTARTSRQKFMNALAKIPSTEPAVCDRLPSVSRKEKVRVSKKK